MAEADIAYFNAMHEAGKIMPKSKSDLMLKTYMNKQVDFPFNMGKCVIPADQKQLQVAFIAMCKLLNKFLAQEENCLDEHKAQFDPLIAELAVYCRTA